MHRGTRIDRGTPVRAAIEPRAPRPAGGGVADAEVRCRTMTKGRLEAFSDGVIAILITIMVLELKVPHGDDWAALQPLGAVFCTYVLSFAFLGIYWNNHHHMLHATQRINGRILWANLHLLFWLSLIPFTTGWTGETRMAPLPTALYGVVLLLSGVAYLILQQTIIADQGENSRLKAAVGRDLKGKASAVLYLSAVLIALSVSPLVAVAIYVAVALIWLIPDRRIEAHLEHDGA
jgi:uncharacterized membrane protein